jgi:microcystin-dependent protein
LTYAQQSWVDNVTPVDAAHMNHIETGIAAVESGALAAGVPTGAGIDFYGTTAPTGFLLCDGSAVSRTTYAALFAVISTRFGAGDGSTTFNLPDSRGRTTVGVGTHADVASVGLNDGAAVGTRRPKHSHAFSLSAADHAHGGTANSVSYSTGSVGGPWGSFQGTGASADGVGQLNIANSGPLGVTGSVGVAGMSDSEGYLVATKIIKT